MLDCPYNGPCPERATDLPSFEQLEQIRRTDPERLSTNALLGLRLQRRLSPPSGRPGPLESRPAMAVPVVADQPAHVNYAHILDGNSPNHDRRGQNVLFSDGSVRFHHSPESARTTRTFT